MLTTFHPAILAYRFSWIAILVLTAVLLANVTVNDTDPSSAKSGGLPNCFKCQTGWNWHVMYYTIAFPIFMTEAILAFKVPILTRSTMFSRMVWHTILQSACLAMSIVGLYAMVLAKQNVPAYGSMYSVHSWTGIVVLCFLGVEYFVGLAVFVVFKSMIPKVALRPLAAWHSFFGKVTVLLGLECCINGWADYQMMMVMAGQAYSSSELQMQYFGKITGPPTTTFYEAGLALAYYFQLIFVFYVLFFPIHPRSVADEVADKLEESSGEEKYGEAKAVSEGVIEGTVAIEA